MCVVIIVFRLLVLKSTVLPKRNVLYKTTSFDRSHNQFTILIIIKEHKNKYNIIMKKIRGIDNNKKQV